MEEDRAAIVAEWQAKVNTLREQIQVMQAKVEKEEALEADIWRLRKELKSIQQQRTSLVLYFLRMNGGRKGAFRRNL